MSSILGLRFCWSSVECDNQTRERILSVNRHSHNHRHLHTLASSKNYSFRRLWTTSFFPHELNITFHFSKLMVIIIITVYLVSDRRTSSAHIQYMDLSISERTTTKQFFIINLSHKWTTALFFQPSNRNIAPSSPHVCIIYCVISCIFFSY